MINRNYDEQWAKASCCGRNVRSCSSVYRNQLFLWAPQEYGARPLKRALEKHPENQLSLKILEGKIPEHTEITADSENEKIVFS
jgi:ATP-dependent Clp protease ATP-binding subunit ClpA